MRVPQRVIEELRMLCAAEFGPDAEIRLFGSRLDDRARGGDIDLFVASPHPVKRPALQGARLAARASRLLDGRKVDVVVSAPNLQDSPVHGAARRYGVRL